MACRSPPCANKSFCTIYESGVLAQGGGGRIVYGPKTSDRADKNAVSV